MNDTMWYYAKDEEELGPVPTSKLKSMATSGDLLPSDLVWKEGMDDWAPAETLRGLFPANQSGTVPVTPRDAGTPLTPPPVSAPQHTANANTATGGFSAVTIGGLTLRQWTRLAGWPVLLTGLMMVVWARGCDSLSERYAAKVTAEANLAVSDFEGAYKRRRAVIVTAQEKLRESGEVTPADRRDLDRLTEELSDLDESYNEDKEALEAGEWARLKAIAEDATATGAIWAYYHELAFVLGALVLSLGLIAVGAAGEGPERWICLIMLAIITFSVFVGGSAWLPAG